MKRSQGGMASIVVISVLVVIMTLISLGFARIMSRSISNSTNRQASTIATYTAHSAINDVAAYIKNNPTAKSDSCTGDTDSLIGNPAHPGAFYYDANNIGNGASYSCILLNQFPTDLYYQQIAANKSRVVKATTTAFSGALDKLMISWQSSNGAAGFNQNPTRLNDATNWNSDSSGVCKDTSAANAGCVPMLEVSFYPVPVGGDLSSMQSKERTIFLYPQNGVGNVPTYDYMSLKDGDLKTVNCTKTVGSTGGVSDFNGSADFTCNIIVKNLTLTYPTPAKIDYTYMKITPIYNQADVKIKANDAWQQVVQFKNTQAMIDVTANYSNVSKRLQARIDTSSINNTPAGEDDNIGSNLDAFPNQTLRSANAICKRMVQTISSFSYISFDTPSNVCHDSDSMINLPSPTLVFSINGVDSQTNSPSSSPYYGISYVPAGGSAALQWTSTNATDCSSAGGVWGTGASQKAYMGPFDPLDGTSTGNRTFSGITSVSYWSLVCTRTGGVDVGGGNSSTNTYTSPTRTVVAWPPPTVSISGPGNITAGYNYSVSYSSNNAQYCVTSGSWTSPGTLYNPSNASWGPNSGAPWGPVSQTMSIGYQDNSTKTFNVTCYDPSGRSATATISYVGTPSCSAGAGSVCPPPPPCSGGSGATCPIYPPPCTATVNLSDSWDGYINYSWDGRCPRDGNWALGTYSTWSSTDGISSTSRTGSGASSRRTSNFCLETTSSLSPWGKLADSGMQCMTPSTPGSGGNPPCTASISPYNNGNGTGGFTWSGSCPQINPNRGYYQLYNCVNIDCANIGTNPGWVGTSGTQGVGTGHFCAELRAGADPWGWLADSGQVCWDIYPPLSASLSTAGVWDQGPECDALSGMNNTWWCRGNADRVNPSPPDCADGVHRWTTCNVHWSTSGGYGTVNCTAGVIGYGNFASSSWPAGGGPMDTGSEGWLGAGAITGWMYLNCSDSAGQTANASA